jgi:hypothetical protein
MFRFKSMLQAAKAFGTGLAHAHFQGGFDHDRYSRPGARRDHARRKISVAGF